MHITQDNYEQFFLDHAEGNLSPEMEKELSYFLEANPDLKTVLQDFDPSPLPSEEMDNEALKKRLKKYIAPTLHIDQVDVDDWMIRDIESLLDEAEENELEEFLTLNPAYRFDYKIFWYTKLSPDLSITYRQKKELKKKAARFPIMRLAWLLPAAAAVILLFIGIRFLHNPEVNSVKQAIADENVLVKEIPVSVPPGTQEKLTNAEIKSIGTPSGTPSHEIAVSLRLKSYLVLAVVSQDQSESSPRSLDVNNIPPSLIGEKKKDKPLIAKVFNNLIAQAREGFGRSTKLNKARKTDFNIWSIAEAGIIGYNSLSGRELELYIHKDEDGKVKSYALVDQERLILEKELNKN